MARPFRILAGLARRWIPGRRTAESFDSLYLPTDLGSVKEVVERHAHGLRENRDIKGFFTSDHSTIETSYAVLRSVRKADKRGKFERDPKFFEDKIFSQPIHSTAEAGSVRIIISDIGDFPEHNRAYQESKHRNVMLCVGGPAAEDQTVLASLIEGIASRLDEVVFMTRDYKESNVNHAAKQSHARHGNALNADRTLTGHSLLPLIVMRNLIGVTPEEALDPDYKKIDVKFTIDPKKLRIYFGNELNYLKQRFLEETGHLTEHDINRLESVFSQEILNVVEQESGMVLSGGIDRSLEDSSSIHVSFTARNAREVEHENEEFKRAGISAEELSPDEIDLVFGEEGKKHIHSAWKYPGDSHVKFDAHQQNKSFATSKGARWVEGEQVERIFVTKDAEGKPRFAGILTKSGEYIYGSMMHATLGYKAEYVFDPDSEVRKMSAAPRKILNSLEDFFGLQPPLSSEITTATGVSINAVFKKSPRMRRLIERFGSTGEIAVTNSHWTMIAENEDYIVMRITGGGNTGSEEYNPAYVINVIANTRRIFGSDLIGVLSTYGCPKAVNARNSTEFAKLAEGLVVSYGKGGTGNTKRHAEAITALTLLGFGPEVVEYFNKFQGRKGDALGKEAEAIHKHLEDIKFVHDNTRRTGRRMGYDDSISFAEMWAIGLMVACSSYALQRGREKKDGDRVIEVVDDSCDPKEVLSNPKLVGPLVKTQSQRKP